MKPDQVRGARVAFGGVQRPFFQRDFSFEPF